MDPTKNEEHAIRTLKHVAQKWPNSLWIFATGNQLHVMRCTPSGERAMLSNGSVDPSYCIDTVNLPSDGGDW